MVSPVAVVAAAAPGEGGHGEGGPDELGGLLQVVAAERVTERGLEHAASTSSG